MWRAGRPKGGANRILAWRLATLPVCALALAACTTDGQVTGSLGSGSLIGGRGGTVAFESIDGPPQPVFQKLVENLASEAVARQVRVISREATPAYRIRGYMAAHLQGKRIHIGWVWDVYDGNKRRVLRIASEEPAGRRAGDAWSAADDAMLRRIAQTSMDRLAVFLDPSGRPPAEPPSDGGGVAVAAADDVAPQETAGPGPQPPVSASQRAQRAQRATALQAALALANTRP